MTDQEILEKYRGVIEKSIAKPHEYLNVTDGFENQVYSDAYKKGFAEGKVEGN